MSQLRIKNYELRIGFEKRVMKTGNIIQEKTFSFAVKIVRLYKLLSQEKKEFIISKQVLRSGTSIGANVEEAIGGQSKADFIAKLSISYKEARETLYWIKLLKETEFLSNEMAEDYIHDVHEICNIIAKIQISSKSRPIS